MDDTVRLYHDCQYAAQILVHFWSEWFTFRDGFGFP